MIVALAMALGLAAGGGPVGHAAAGRSIAERNCGGCHAVGQRVASRRPDAPPLRSLKARYPFEYLEEALAEGISVGHPDMPSIELTPQQIADFQAYLSSLDAPARRRMNSSRPR